MTMGADTPRRYFPPGSGDIHATQIAVPKQHLQLKGGKRSRSGVAGFSHPTEAPLGQALVAKPEALPVAENTQRGALLVAKDKECPREGIAQEDFLGDPAQPVDAFTKVDRLHAHENTHVGSDLNHRLSARKAVMGGKNCKGKEASARISI